MAQVTAPGGSGGAYSYRQLEQLWIAAGGPRRRAPLMAAIAMAESGGHPGQVNRTDNNGTQTSWGLWQISDGTHSKPVPNILDPVVNARQAVAKWRSQGLKAWGTYTSGAYKKFLQSGPVPGVIAGGESFVKEAEKFLGTPYVWGGASPKGFDCSGLVQYALQQVGVKNVPGTSEAQWAWARKISYRQLKPGDLIFEQWPGDQTAPGHVVIYAGHNQIIQAPQTGQNVEKVPFTPQLVAQQGGRIVGYGRPPGINGAGGGGGGGGGGWSGWLSSIGDALAGGIGGDVAGGIAAPAQQISGTAAGLAGITQTLVAFETHIAWFFVPNHWVRIFAGAGGIFLTGAGLFNIARTGRPYSIQMPAIGSVPAPGGQLAPALGIAEVTVGAVLLFVAFHNLPPDVTDFPSLISHLQGQLQSGGKQG